MRFKRALAVVTASVTAAAGSAAAVALSAGPAAAALTSSVALPFSSYSQTLVDPVHHHDPARRPLTADRIEARTLAGTVWADDRQQASGFDIERDAIDSERRAITDLKVLDLQQRRLLIDGTHR